MNYFCIENVYFPDNIVVFWVMLIQTKVFLTFSNRNNVVCCEIEMEKAKQKLTFKNRLLIVKILSGSIKIWII